MFATPTIEALRSSWALFAGIGFIMLANGLQGTLLALRASMEGFSTTTVGMFMSGYFIGMIVGSIHTPRLVERVGHIRVFAALASAASIAVLIHSVWVNPYNWGVMRFVTGYCYAGLYIVAESWLNDRATNETRGRILSIYGVTIFSGLGLGQLLLNVSHPFTADLFILASVLVSFALVPILLTARPAPTFSVTSKISILELSRLAPLGVFSNFATGIAHGTLFSLGAVYGQQMNLSVQEISWFMACFLFGAVSMQWPIGIVSDQFDRRTVLVFVSSIACVVALSALWLPHDGWWLYAGAFFLGGTALPMYSLSIACANDRLPPEQMVGASATLVLIAGIGLVLGPIVGSITMDRIGPQAYFLCMGCAFGLIVLFAIYRMNTRRWKRVEEQVPYVPAADTGCSTVAVALAAETALEQMNEGLHSDADTETVPQGITP